MNFFKNKIVLAVIVVIVVLIILYFVFRGKSETLGDLEAAITGTHPGITPAAITAANDFKAGSNYASFSEMSDSDWGGLAAFIKVHWLNTTHEDPDKKYTGEIQARAVGFFKGLNVKADGWAAELLWPHLKHYLENSGARYEAVTVGKYLPKTTPAT